VEPVQEGEEILAQYAVLITHREILGYEPKLSELHSVLAPYRRKVVVLLLAKLNSLLRTWENTPDFEIDAKLTRIILPSYALRIDKLRGATNGRILFSRITFLYLVKQACIACSDDGQPLGGPKGVEAIGLACLMANDLMLPFMPSPQDGTLEKLANILPFTDYMPQDQYPIEIARAERMFEIAEEHLTLRERSDFVDLKAEFESKLGISHLTFSQLVFGCATKFLNVQLEDLASPEAGILRSTYFQKSAISPDKITKYFQKMTISESEFADKIRESNERPGDDFTLFQAHPLIEIFSGLYACLDPGFLVDKAGRGLFWTIFAEMDNKQKSKLLSFRGAVFETYVNSILQSSYGAGGRFFPEPKFANGDTAFDACLIEEQRLIVFEHKSSTIRADCKYGGDAGKLKAELHLKFVDGDDDGAKGVAQLTRNLIRFLNGESAEGIASGDVKRIYPCLVCLDATVSVPYVGRYFNEQFSSVFPSDRFSQTISPLMTLNVSDVEALLGYLQKYQLSDIFDSFNSQNESMLATISTAGVPLLQDVQPGVNVVLEGFSKFGRRIEEDLFPEQARQ
jgi:hypothetical protein